MTKRDLTNPWLPYILHLCGKVLLHLTYVPNEIGYQINTVRTPTVRTTQVLWPPFACHWLLHWPLPG